jgi:hypothetical protein
MDASNTSLSVHAASNNKGMETVDKNHKKAEKMPCFWLTAWKHYENELP